MKNRPFYTATDETVLVEESTVSFVGDGYDFYMAEFPSTFEATVGETYKISWDGTVYECTCVDFNDVPVMGNLSIIEAGSDTGEPFLMDLSHVGRIDIATKDTSASHTFSISIPVTEVVKIDEKYLPDTVATKSEVEAAQEVLDGVFSSVATFTFDKQTSGRDTFVFNAFHYYKISDFNPALSDVISFKGTTESGNEYSGINIGNNCVSYGDDIFIIVASAGDCSLSILGTTTTKHFIAPSAGLYAIYEVDDPYQTARTGEFTLRSSTGSLYITGLLLKSSTAGSTKKFRITVDDDYNVSATNTSDSVSKALATTEYVDNSVSNPLNITSAAVGQIAKITAVDDTGKPTAWEAVDMPLGGGGETWELINEITIPDNAEETNALVINEDLNGNPFELKKALLFVYMPKYTGESTIPKFAFSSLNGIHVGGSTPATYTRFVSPNSAHNRSMWWRVSVANNGLPYHEELAKTDVSGDKRAIGGSGSTALFDEYIIDGTEPVKESITEIGTKGNLIYAGCYFALYGVRK